MKSKFLMASILVLGIFATTACTGTDGMTNSINRVTTDDYNYSNTGNGVGSGGDHSVSDDTDSSRSTSYYNDANGYAKNYNSMTNSVNQTTNKVNERINNGVVNVTGNAKNGVTDLNRNNNNTVDDVARNNSNLNLNNNISRSVANPKSTNTTNSAATENLNSVTKNLLQTHDTVEFNDVKYPAKGYTNGGKTKFYNY